ncbi:MAG: hypothetical protein HKN49_05295 [Gammaproteobacteria bacterium]|nr:hypothetical protein [Gammaproteobacteria bacterium]
MSTTMDATTPWYRQFWPWFVIALPATVVIASMITIWLAIEARPERVDFPGTESVTLQFVDDTVMFTLGQRAASWPAELEVHLLDTATGQRWTLEARRVDTVRYLVTPPVLAAGTYDVEVRLPDPDALLLHGNWAYPAPAWKMSRTGE